MSSSHSRSSSGTGITQYRDILPIFIDIFKDFEFTDVYENVKILFNDSELKLIENQSDNKFKINLLISLLHSKTEEENKNFFNLITKDYYWLVENVKNGGDELKREKYIKTLNTLRSENPEFTDFNVRRMEPFMKLHKAVMKLEPNHKVVVEGSLGIGKKWLTFDVISDYRVMEKMDFKIFSIDVSQCVDPENDILKLKELLIKVSYSCSCVGFGVGSNICENNYCNANGVAGVSGTVGGTIGGTICFKPPKLIDNNYLTHTIITLQSQIKLKLQSEQCKNCLLILENVQNRHTTKVFNLGCKTLIITRFPKIYNNLSKKMTQHIKIGDEGLTTLEFELLFEKYLKINYKEFPKNAEEIHKSIEGHPQLLSIIAKNLANGKIKDWKQWTDKELRESKNGKKFIKVIATALKILNKDQLNLYYTFAIFPHYVAIPFKLLAHLWNKSVSDAQNFIQTFLDYSFLSSHKINEKTTQDNFLFKVPFIYSEHLKKNLETKNNINQKELHQKIIDYYMTSLNLEFCNDLYDNYYFECIGYHMHEAQVSDKFGQLYLNFIFLEQKIRNVGLIDTIGDLKLYEKEITNSDPVRKKLLDEIFAFLPKVEEKLEQSNDTRLLQYAFFMKKGPIYDAAIQQLISYPEKYFFEERGNFHKRREIFKLNKVSKSLKLLDADNCLIIQDVGTYDEILLTDISVEQNFVPVVLTDDKLRKIIAAHLLMENKYLLTLDEENVLKLWSIPTYEQRKKASKVDYSNVKKIFCKKQDINDILVIQKPKIVAFYVEANDVLHVATENDKMYLLKWDCVSEKFIANYIPTAMESAIFICKITNEHFMNITIRGNLIFRNFKNGSSATPSFEWQQVESKFVGCELFHNNHLTIAYIIFADRIIKLSFNDLKNIDTIIGEKEIIYEIKEFEKNSIKCAKLSSDGYYLVLGTENGVNIFDTKINSIILLTNISECVNCVDIYELDDKIYKYIIVFGGKHKWIHILALRKTDNNSIGWSHDVSVSNSENTNNLQLEPNVWLRGSKFYDIDYEDENDQFYLIAADSKNRIHEICTKSNKNWSIIPPPEPTYKITALTTLKGRTFVGSNEGKIYYSENGKLEKHKSQLEFEEDIDYLQLLDTNILVASTAAGVKKTKTCIYNLTTKVEKDFDFDTVRTFKIDNNYLLLISRDLSLQFVHIREDGQDINCLICNSKAENSYKIVVEGIEKQLTADLTTCCDFQNLTLFLAANKNVNISTITNKNQIIHVNINMLHSFESKFISCISANNIANLLAVGFYNGDIKVCELYQNRTEIGELYCLKSHRKPIWDMKFSQNSNILVSCSEQLCFWNLEFVYNNPLFSRFNKERRSSRYSSQRSMDVTDTVAFGNKSNSSNRLTVSSVTNDIQSLQLATKNGPTNKPKLLGCIKFDGNKAEKFFTNAKFTQFQTIDNEGVHFHLNLLDVNQITLTQKQQKQEEEEEEEGAIGEQDQQQELDNYDDNVFI